MAIGASDVISDTFSSCVVLSSAVAKSESSFGASFSDAATSLTRAESIAGSVTKEFGAEIIDEIPLCSGGDGPMVLKTGTKEGKEYRGWVCPTPKSGHPAKWMRIGSDGHWVFQK